MKKAYSTAELDVMEFEETDVVRTSNPPQNAGGNSSQNKTPILSGAADRGSQRDVFI